MAYHDIKYAALLYRKGSAGATGTVLAKDGPVPFDKTCALHLQLDSCVESIVTQLCVAMFNYTNSYNIVRHEQTVPGQEYKLN